MGGIRQRLQSKTRRVDRERLGDRIDEASLFLSVKNLDEFTNLLHLSKFELVDLLLNKFETFTIPKRDRSRRLITKPTEAVLKLQRTLNFYLQSVYLTTKPQNVFGSIPNTGGKEKFDILENAQLHQGKSYVVNIDLKDFFGSIDARKIQNLFAGYPFSFNNEICGLLSKIVIHDNKLPIGAATSPVIANFLFIDIDNKFNSLAVKYNGAYSRYIDDITFSFDKYPNTEFLKVVMSDLSNEGYQIAWDKFRIHGKNQRQEVTGLTVNVLPNVKAIYYKDLRATIYNLFNKNFDEEVDKYVDANIQSYRRSIKHYWQRYYRRKEYEIEIADAVFLKLYSLRSGKTWYTLNSIEGKLSYVQRILGNKHPKYLKLLQIGKIYGRFTIPTPELNPDFVYVTNAASRSIVNYAFSFLKLVEADNDEINKLMIKIGLDKKLRWADLYDSFTNQNIYFLELYKFIRESNGFNDLRTNNITVQDWFLLERNLSKGLFERKIFHVKDNCESLRSPYSEDVFYANSGIFATEETAKYNKPYLLERSYLEKLGMRVCRNCGESITRLGIADI